MGAALAHPVADLFGLLEQLGPQRYGLERVSQLDHALQCAHLAESCGADDALVAAALLHDIGHLLQQDLHQAAGEDHAVVGARHLAQWFGAGVVEPVRLHAQAKRYLVAVEPTYFGGLSGASRRSLRWQGGAMTPSEADAFRALPFAQDALSLRRWDDLAKEPGIRVPPLAHYRGLVDDLLDGRHSQR